MTQCSDHQRPDAAPAGLQERLLDEIARSEAALLPLRMGWQHRYVVSMRTAFVTGTLAAGVPLLVSIGSAARTQLALTLAVVAAGAAASGGVAWFGRRGHLVREARARALMASLAVEEGGAGCATVAAGYLAALNNMQA